MKFRIFLAVFFCANVSAQNFTDPNPPKVAEAQPVADAEPKDFPALTFHQKPKPLPDDAVVSDWPRFLGPTDDCKSPETRLLKKFPQGGPTIVWEMEKGTGYTSPVIVDDRLYFFDRIGDEETLQCLDPATGKEFWRTSYPIEYTDRYGFSNGPRASAVVDSGKIYTAGVTGILSCHDAASGSVLWRRDLQADFKFGDLFFGFGVCPVIFEGKVMLNLGGENQLAVAAFDQHTGKLLWGTKHEWRASYSSPVVKTLRGKPRLLVFAGGESRPAFGGLLVIDPDTGQLFDSFPWRAPKYESVNAQTPIVLGENRVFISDAYEIGGICLELTEDLKLKPAWKSEFFGMHWMTPVSKNGHLFGFRGRNEPDAWFTSFNAETGKENWKEETRWTETLPNGRDYNLSYFRGSLLLADGRGWALGELGTLGIFDLNAEKFSETDRVQLFLARSTWSLPVLSQGLLYISQHEADFITQKPPRLICYDLRDE